jgi:hypothetical protein
VQCLFEKSTTADGVFSGRDFLSTFGVGAGLPAVGGCADFGRWSVNKGAQGKNVGCKWSSEMKEFRDPIFAGRQGGFVYQ